MNKKILTLKDDCDAFYIKNDMYITIRNPIIFKGRFTSDRYESNAFSRLNEYGKSLYNSKIIFKTKFYKVNGYAVMEGSCGYIGSLIIKVEKVNNK